MKSVGLTLLLVLLAGATARAAVTVTAEGAPGDLVDNVRARLELADEPCDAPDWRLQRRFRRAEQAVVPALQAFGFYTAQIDKRFERSDDCWHATFDIRLGPRTVVTRRDIAIAGAAADDPALEKLLGDLPLAQGSPLNHADYEAIKGRLRQFAAQHGYLDFRFTRRELRVDPARSSAEIFLAADGGPRYRFGEVRIEDQPIDEDLIRRLARVRAGQPFDAQAVTALDRELSDSGYFDRVEVRVLRDQASDARVPIDVRLDAAARHAWRAGLGYATDTGPRASLRYDNRYVNRRGHRIESLLSLSPVLSSLTADYVVPGEDPHRDSFSFGARAQTEETDSADSDSLTLVARHSHKGRKWTQNRFVELLHERSTVAGDTITNTLLMPGIAVDRIEADNLLRTRRGYRINLEVRGAYEGLLSTATLFRVEAGAKGIYRFGDAGRVTARVDAGVSMGDSIEDLPASLRFFAGGDNSVRGYAFQSLGPRDDNDDPVGGRHLLTTSVEYEHPVFGEDWWVAAFADAGNAFDTDSIELRAGYGVGVRWYSPVGRVRLDLAFPDDTRDDQWRIHFGLGADL